MGPIHAKPNRLAAVLILVLSWTAFGQSELKTLELIGDRPDQTESSETVAPGYVQFELGWTYRENDDGRTSSHAFPETLIRIGVVNRLELRVGFDGYIWADADDTARIDGAGDVEIGLKWKLWEESGRRPQTAVLVGTSVPSGEAPFSSERFDPSLRLAFTHTLNETLSLGYNVAGLWATEEDAEGHRDTNAAIAYSAVLGIALTGRLGTFIEFFGETPTDSGTPAHSVDAGLTWLVADNVQIDVLAGVGLSNAADDWFLGAGLTWRIPRR